MKLDTLHQSVTRFFTLCVLRLRVSKSASACSATAWGEYAGTWTTDSPHMTTWSRSTLLQPALRKAMSFTPDFFHVSITEEVTSSLTKQQTTS